MRKLAYFTLICSTALALAACGKKEGTNTPTDAPTNAPTAAPTEEPTTAPTDTPAETPSTEASDSLEFLNTIWNSYSEDDKFPAAGGDFNEGNNKMNAPGKYEITDADALFSVFGFPKDQVDKIDGAASLLHMMNANTFTSGAFHVKNSEDISLITAVIKENISTRQWLCGFPDKLVILATDEYIVSAFGEESLINGFKEAVQKNFTSAELISEVNLME